MVHFDDFFLLNYFVFCHLLRFLYSIHKYTIFVFVGARHMCGANKPEFNSCAEK